MGEVCVRVDRKLTNKLQLSSINSSQVSCSQYKQGILKIDKIKISYKRLFLWLIIYIVKN